MVLCNGLLLWSFSRAEIQCAPEPFTGIYSTKGIVFGVGVLLFVWWCCHCCCLVSEGFLSALSLGKGCSTPGHLCGFFRPRPETSLCVQLEAGYLFMLLLKLDALSHFPWHSTAALHFIFYWAVSQGSEQKGTPSKAEGGRLLTEGVGRPVERPWAVLVAPLSPPSCGTEVWVVLKQMFSRWHLRKLFRAPRTSLKQVE